MQIKLKTVKVSYYDIETRFTSLCCILLYLMYIHSIPPPQKKKKIWYVFMQRLFDQ